jgi:RNA polymerase sigma-70 factor, ECF subfamily
MDAELSPDVDSSLVQRAQAGDEDAFGELMRSHYEPVFRLVVGIVRNEHDARELCQDVWVTVWQRLGTFRGEAKFTTWIHPIAVRRALDHLRKRRRWFDRFLPFAAEREDRDAAGVVATAPEAIDPTPDARTDLERTERREHFESLLASLPPIHRTVLALREVQGLSYDEIAKILRCRPGTVMSRLFHARRLLARKLKDHPCD